jgi:hypothetical protein
MNTTTTMTRRTLIKAGICAGTLLPVVGMVAGRAAAADLVDIGPADPTAKALGYVAKSAKPGQDCAGCAQFVGNAGDAAGGCKIFPGKRVAGAGWCSAYVKKPGT